MLCLPHHLSGQKSTSESYYDYLPSQFPIISQTGASAKMHLYGDSTARNYRDEKLADLVRGLQNL